MISKIRYSVTEFFYNEGQIGLDTKFVITRADCIVIFGEISAVHYRKVYLYCVTNDVIALYNVYHVIQVNISLFFTAALK